MRYYSTRCPETFVSLKEAVIKGLASDGGLFMPERIPVLPKGFFDKIESLSFQEIAFEIADALFGLDVDRTQLKRIVEETVSFPVPIIELGSDIYALELFHGPTMAFKDFGARFMSRLLRYLVNDGNENKDINVLVATSGDTGSAVANGFVGIEGINVIILYPSGKVSAAQEAQFTTLGNNVTALEVDGVFDDCQRIVKEAFNSPELNQQFFLTSANSINIARLLPQSFYYFFAYASLKEILKERKWVVSVPSGNFGNLTAGIIAQKMGLPVSRFIAANNSNNVVWEFLETGSYNPKTTVETVANAMDVGSPSNFERLMAIFGDQSKMSEIISAFWFDDMQIKKAIKECYDSIGYLLDPHGACGYLALKEGLRKNEIGTFLETAHPTKFREVIHDAVDKDFDLHPKLQEFLNRKKHSLKISPSLQSLIDSNTLK